MGHTFVLTDGGMTTKRASGQAFLIEAWNSHDVERVLRCHAPDYEGVDVGSLHVDHGLADLRRTFQRYLNAFPDFRIEVDQVVEHNDRVAISWTATGTHRGRLMNIPPTGRVVTVRGISMLTLKDEKVAKGLHVWDVAGLLRGIKLLPELSA